MKLPHREPLVYAKEVLTKNSDMVEVLCRFDTIPTLPMFVEAAAQSSSAFNLDGQAKIGFLTMAKDVKLLNSIKKKSYVIKVEIKVEINNIKQFYFEVFSNKKYVSGYFTLIIQE